MNYFSSSTTSVFTTSNFRRYFEYGIKIFKDVKRHGYSGTGKDFNANKTRE